MEKGWEGGRSKEGRQERDKQGEQRWTKKGEISVMSWSYYWGRGDGRIGDKSRDHALPVASSGEGRLRGSTVHHHCYCLQQKPERKVINNASRVICRTHHEPGLFPLRPCGCGCGWCASAYIRTYSYSGDMQIPEGAGREG